MESLRRIQQKPPVSENEVTFFSCGIVIARHCDCRPGSEQISPRQRREDTLAIIENNLATVEECGVGILKNIERLQLLPGLFNLRTMDKGDVSTTDRTFISQRLDQRATLGTFQYKRRTAVGAEIQVAVSMFSTCRACNTVRHLVTR